MPRPPQYHRRRDPRHQRLPRLKLNSTPDDDTMHRQIAVLLTAVSQVLPLHRRAVRELVF